jgi:hypothetical protein
MKILRRLMCWSLYIPDFMHLQNTYGYCGKLDIVLYMATCRLCLSKRFLKCCFNVWCEWVVVVPPLPVRAGVWTSLPASLSRTSYSTSGGCSACRCARENVKTSLRVSCDSALMLDLLCQSACSPPILCRRSWVPLIKVFALYVFAASQGHMF